MRIIQRIFRCSAIVQPGEYMIDWWDNKQCEEDNPRQLVKCEHCGKSFCLALHWHKHINSFEAPF